MSERYFKNPFKDYTPDTSFSIDEKFLKDLITKYVKKILEHTDPQKHKINYRSRGDLYVGFSGIAFMLFKLSKSSMANDFPALERAKMYSDIAEKILALLGSQKHISLLSGNAGVHVMSAAVSKALNKNIDKNIKNLLLGMNIFENPQYLDDGQDEMLVGRCGYVLGIQWLQNELNLEIISNNDMNKLAQIMLESGRNYARENEHKVPLMFQYHGREYLGAAHGISAILFSLLNVDLNETDLRDVKKTIDAILAFQDDIGNFPSKFNKPETHLVHWCHGAPGIIYLMAKAYNIFNEQRYLESCLRCGDLTWEKGLLKKGPGMCHGIASSGYVFLILFRLTNDQKYLYRGMKFAEFLVNKRFLDESREPDRPYSLYEGKKYFNLNDPAIYRLPFFSGLSGTVCFLLDLLQPEKAEFPFMNVF